MPFHNQFSKYELPILTNGVRWPAVIISAEDKAKLNLPADCTNLLYLKTLCWSKCLDKMRRGVITEPKEQVVSRLKDEFEIFEKTGTTDYILLLLSIISAYREKGIKLGVSRGSAGGSFALYALDLIGLDGIRHDLIFSRFLNEARAKCKIIDGVKYVDGKTSADVDIDVEQERRPEAVKIIDDLYPGKTCKISTVQYLTGKMAIKDVLKVYLNYAEHEAKAISDEFETVFGTVDSIDKTYEKSATFREWVDADPKHKEAMALAKQIEGLTLSYGCHASGIIVSYYPLEDVMPLELSSSDEIVSGYSMEYALTFVPKVDILGIATLNVLGVASESAGVDFSKIDVNDPAIYSLLNSSEDFYGLFQISSGVTKDACLKIKPRNLDHLATVLSIGRPGSLKYVDQFAKFVNEGAYKPIHPAFDKILMDTGMIIIYQEQISKICNEIYGFSGTSSDDVRRCIGKKDGEGMRKWEPELYAAGKQRGIPEDVTTWFWQTCKDSADYLFNKCLSPDTVVDTPDGQKMLFEVAGGDMVRAHDRSTNGDIFVSVLDTVLGEAELWEVETEDGHTLRCSMEHKIVCEDGKMRALKDVLEGKYRIMTD